VAERLVIGSRRSRLAMRQAESVKELLTAAHPGLQVEILPIVTSGDRSQERGDGALLSGKGVFVQEIEEALMSGRIDAAVHSAKDVPAELPGDVALVAFPAREDPRDVLAGTKGRWLSELPPNAVVATSSPRRAVQLKLLRADVTVVPVRGNVDTRLRKAAEGEYQAAVLAAAGLLRLGLFDEISQWFEPEEMLPAPGQGALCVEARTDDQRVRALMAACDDAATRVAVLAERAFLTAMGGGCDAPIGALGTVEGDRLDLAGLVAAPDSGRVVRERISGPAADPEGLARALAERVLAAGGQECLDEVARGRVGS
jgi:hydroxymethylbilane synthase